MIIPQGDQEQEVVCYSTCEREQVVTMGNNEDVMVMSASQLSVKLGRPHATPERSDGSDSRHVRMRTQSCVRLYPLS